MQSFVRWSLCFFSYCFIGWVWETLYVFVRTGRWENRGLLYSPLLPIYGIGALVILYVTAPVQTNPWLIFLLGMLGASAVEYIGGTLTDILFHTRYWDYSGSFLNLHGHICLLCSLAWGLFSILLVKWIHPGVRQLFHTLPTKAGIILTGILFFTIGIDFIISSRVLLHQTYP